MDQVLAAGWWAARDRWASCCARAPDSPSHITLALTA